MNQRMALVASILLTTFLLVIGVGLATKLTLPAVAPTATLPAVDTGTDPLIAPDREAAYQQALRQANQQLAKANQQIAEANRRAALDKTKIEQANTQIGQVRQSTTNPEPVIAPQPELAESAVPTYQLQPAQARTRAQAAANGSPITREPELVNYENQIAYEVLFAAGAIYVDANSGQIIFNGTTPALPNSGIQGDHEREHEGQHENGDDND